MTTAATQEPCSFETSSSQRDTDSLSRLFSELDLTSGCHHAIYDGERENVRESLSFPTPTTDESRMIRERIEAYGFAIVSLPTGLAAPEIVRTCNRLGFNYVFVPDYLKTMPGMLEACGMNFIPPYPNPALPPVSKHKAFLGSQEHPFHVDGANCPGIGMVKTAVLYCVTPAAQGGESTVFNARAAVRALAREDIDLVAPLFDPRALTRNGSAELTGVDGPGFAFVNGELKTRYSVDYASHWNCDVVTGLATALSALEELSKPGSDFYTQTPLEAGELLIMANDAIAHGRLGFSNSDSIIRRMGRVLFFD